MRSSIGPAWVLGAKPAPDTSGLVLRWKLDRNGSRILFHCPDHAALVAWVSTAPGLCSRIAEKDDYQVLGTIAEAYAFIEECVFRMEGNWLLKRWNEPLTGLLRHFLFWLAYKQLAEASLAAGQLTRCMERFAPEVDLTLFDGWPDGKVMAAFVQQFFRGRNDLTAYWKALSERP